MIKQAAIGLDSRNNTTIHSDKGFLPLITAPMYSVCNEQNYQIFLDAGIQVCLPRGIYSNKTLEKCWVATSLDQFITDYCNSLYQIPETEVHHVCIDTANGNMPKLHQAIRNAKSYYKNRLIIMSGNVASVEAFIELSKAGCDFIRVGIGQGAGCNTASNTGVSQKNLGHLIKKCSEHKFYSYNYTKKDSNTMRKVKIVADGISSYVKLCKKKYGYNDNGYAAINKLLDKGADLVMIGKLFAQCLESAGEKSVLQKDEKEHARVFNKTLNYKDFSKGTQDYRLRVLYSGMSTHMAQKNYRSSLKPSEGKSMYIPVRWILDEWLNGNLHQDDYPYLMGWTNSIKSAMSYQGKTTLNK